MTTNNHPITPPPELVRQWLAEKPDTELAHIYLATQAARWGADQELEACCEVLRQKGVPAWSMLRSNRRPKPPSLKEQALESLRFLGGNSRDVDTIRRALEQLDD